MAMFERVINDGVRRGHPITIVVDDTPVPAFTGESVATTLLANDRMTLRHTPKSRAPRGVFCAMGVCFECLVTIDGISQMRACMTPVRDGMRIETADRASAETPLDPGPESPPAVPPPVALLPAATWPRPTGPRLTARKDPDGSL